MGQYGNYTLTRSATLTLGNQVRVRHLKKASHLTTNWFKDRIQHCETERSGSCPIVFVGAGHMEVLEGDRITDLESLSQKPSVDCVVHQAGS